MATPNVALQRLAAFPERSLSHLALCLLLNRFSIMLVNLTLE
jgi:hypothetical protein